MDDDMEQITSSSNESAPKPRLAFVALILSLSSILFCGMTIAINIIFGEYIHYGLAGLMALCASCLGILAPLVGIVMGGMTLVRKESNTLMAIIAILLGLIAMIATGFMGFFTLLVCCTAM